MSKLLVIGSANMDVIIEVDKVPKAGESTICGNIKTAPGGKGANQAVAAARLGCPTTFVGKIGDDEYGKALLSNLEENKVDITYVTESEAHTGIAYIILESNGQNRILVSAGANLTFNEKDLKLIESIIDDYEMILLQLEIPLNTIEAIIHLAKSKNKKIIVDAGPVRKCNIEMFRGIDILSPNETEMEKLTGMEIKNIEDGLKAANLLLKKGIGKIVLKMGEKGALFVDNNGYKLIPAYKTKVIDTTAAGDAFTAALAVRLLEGSDIIPAIEYANKVGALTVTKMGAQPSLPYRCEVENNIWEVNGGEMNG
jgi:ribokinase